MKKIFCLTILSAFFATSSYGNSESIYESLDNDVSCTQTTTTTHTCHPDGSESTTVTVTVTCDTPQELVEFNKANK